jgi:hemolysin III
VTLSPPRSRTKPRLRGLSHEIAAFVAAPAVLALLASARSARAQAAAAIYGASVFALFSVSALYHRPTWTPRARAVVGRIDHSMIFLAIAGTYTPLCLLLGPAGGSLLATVWGGAALGVLFSVAWDSAPKPLRAAVCALLGWSFLPLAPVLRASLPADAFRLLVAGALVYTAGGVVFTLRRPDPIPTVFGFHEIFHLLVIAGATCHYLMARALIAALG